MPLRAAREAAPAAVQVADRFHLWQDLAEAVEKTVLACLAALSPPSPGPQDPQPAVVPAGPAGAPAEPDGFRDQHGHQRRLVARHRERYAAVQALRAEGCTIREIARRLGLARNTVLKFAQAASIDELLVKSTSRPSVLDPFKPCLNQRRNDGCTSAAALHEEIRARGWKGSILTVEHYMRQFRTADGRDRQARAQPQLTAPSAPPLPKPRQVTRWIMTHPDHLASHDAADLARLLDASPGLAAAAGHVRSFAGMMTRRQGLLALEDWLTAVEASDQPALRSFARGIRRDQHAVTAGLALPHSSGALEGKNCKIKYLKRHPDHGPAGRRRVRRHRPAARGRGVAPDRGILAAARRPTVPLADRRIAAEAENLEGKFQDLAGPSSNPSPLPPPSAPSSPKSTSS